MSDNVDSIDVAENKQSTFDYLLEQKAWHEWQEYERSILNTVCFSIMQDPKSKFCDRLLNAHKHWHDYLKEEKIDFLFRIMYKFSHLAELNDIRFFTWNSWKEFCRSQGEYIEEETDLPVAFYTSRVIEIPSIVFVDSMYFETNNLRTTLDTLFHEFSHALIDIAANDLWEQLTYEGQELDLDHPLFLNASMLFCDARNQHKNDIYAQLDDRYSEYLDLLGERAANSFGDKAQARVQTCIWMLEEGGWRTEDDDLGLHKKFLKELKPQVESFLALCRERDFMHEGLHLCRDVLALDIDKLEDTKEFHENNQGKDWCQITGDVLLFIWEHEAQFAQGLKGKKFVEFINEKFDFTVTSALWDFHGLLLRRYIGRCEEEEGF